MGRVRPRLIALYVDGVDRSNEVSKAVITSAPTDADWQSMQEQRQGGARDYALNMVIAQDHATGTLFDLIWTEPGSLVAGVYAPDGNAEATAGSPHFDFEAKVSEPDGDFLGAEGSSSTTAVATNEVTWALTGKPTKRSMGSVVP